MGYYTNTTKSFNTQPPEGGWNCLILTMYRVVCFNTQPPEGGWAKAGNKHVLIIVSTHSRLKAAGAARTRGTDLSTCFNTQPPEGGWATNSFARIGSNKVSTHSRLKAADQRTGRQSGADVSTHSRLKAAAAFVRPCAGQYAVSTHSRLKAAVPSAQNSCCTKPFQHTAA